eukprot:2515810-Rhodomonas_salina.4
MSGTAPAYSYVHTSGLFLAVCYAVSGTELAYGATRVYARDWSIVQGDVMRGTEIAYAATSTLECNMDRLGVFPGHVPYLPTRLLCYARY